MATIMTKSKYDESIPFKAYDLAKSGMKDLKIASALGVNWATFEKWKERHPELASALRTARQKRKEDKLAVESFKDYVYQRLNPKLRKVWRAIEEAESDPSAVKRAEFMLSNCGRRMRQHLFVHALVSSNFNPSVACRLVGISRGTMEKWCTKDPDFAALLDEIHWHKGNFFEGCLIELCRNGDTAAILHANRTFNRDRGYGNTVTVEHGGEVTHSHSVSIDDLGLPIEDRRRILQALRERQGICPALPSHDDVEDAEIISVTNKE